jgi:AcrR family transcriptional regulator
MVETGGRDTRERIVEAAGEVFARKGFRRATVREICTRAGVNVAMIKYHFGGKAGLYTAVLEHFRSVAGRRSRQIMDRAEGDGPEARLKAFIRAQLEKLTGSGRPAWFDRLMSREVMDPTRALDAIVETGIRPSAERLVGVVQELLGRNDREPDLLYCCLSIVGQCLHHHYAKNVIARLYPGLAYGPGELDRLAEHITDFSLAGLAAHRKRRDAIEEYAAL